MITWSLYFPSLNTWIASRPRKWKKKTKKQLTKRLFSNQHHKHPFKKKVDVIQELSPINPYLLTLWNLRNCSIFEKVLRSKKVEIGKGWGCLYQLFFFFFFLVILYEVLKKTIFGKSNFLLIWVVIVFYNWNVPWAFFGSVLSFITYAMWHALLRVHKKNSYNRTLAFT